MNENEKIKDFLTKYKKITVVGLSSKPERSSYGVTNYLINNRYEIDAVNPNETQVLSQPIYNNISEVPHQLEIVNVFRAPQHIPQLIDELIPLKPKVIWLQEGITSPEAEEKARQAGIEVVSDRCIYKAHKSLIKDQIMHQQVFIPAV